TTSSQTKKEVTRQAPDRRDQMKKLERMISQAPRVAEEIEKRQREELLMRASEGGSRLDVSMALHDERHGDPTPGKRRGSLRKERREGRILFLVLIITLLIAAIWLLNHLHF